MFAIFSSAWDAVVVVKRTASDCGSALPVEHLPCLPACQFILADKCSPVIIKVQQVNFLAILVQSLEMSRAAFAARSVTIGQKHDAFAASPEALPLSSSPEQNHSFYRAISGS